MLHIRARTLSNAKLCSLEFERAADRAILFPFCANDSASCEPPIKWAQGCVQAPTPAPRAHSHACMHPDTSPFGQSSQSSQHYERDKSRQSAPQNRPLIALPKHASSCRARHSHCHPSPTSTRSASAGACHLLHPHPLAYAAITRALLSESQRRKSVMAFAVVCLAPRK